VLAAVLGVASSVRGGSAPPGSARASRLPSAPISSVFHVEKSENKNQVHYAVRVDERCRPAGKAPVYAYWRDFEDGPKAVSPLLQHEQPAYGLTEPRAIELNESGGEVRIGMRGFPDRALRILTFAQDGGCRARAFTPIQGEPAVLTSIYVELGFLFSVDYVLVRGVRVADGRQVKEKVDD
jgi:hypothetical protein